MDHKGGHKSDVHPSYDSTAVNKIGASCESFKAESLWMRRSARRSLKFRDTPLARDVIRPYDLHRVVRPLCFMAFGFVSGSVSIMPNAASVKTVFGPGRRREMFANAQNLVPEPCDARA